MKGRTVYALNRVDQLEDGMLYTKLLYLYSNRQTAEKQCAYYNRCNRRNVILHNYPRNQYMIDGYIRADNTKKATWFFIYMETIR